MNFACPYLSAAVCGAGALLLLSSGCSTRPGVSVADASWASDGPLVDGTPMPDAAPLPDVPPPDAALPDSARPDAAVPDGARPDAAVPDAPRRCPDDNCIPDAWLGQPLTASGTCTGYAIFHSSCQQGCCSATQPLSELVTDIRFEFLEDPGGLILHVTRIDVGGDVQARDASSPASTDARFRIDPFFFRASGINLRGALGSYADPMGFHLYISADGLGGGGSCGPTEVFRFCDWTRP